MKSFVLVIVAAFLMFRPVWPVVEYILNYDYIVDQLCENRDEPVMNCNGKCFLAKKLAALSEEEENPYERNADQRIQEVLFCQNWSAMNVNFETATITLHEFRDLNTTISSVFYKVPSPPPKSC